MNAKTSETSLKKVKWDKENTRQVKPKLSIKSDKDILDKLDSLDNKQGYIKKLIRADIAKGQE